MRAGAIKAELTSMGVSTVGMLEKSEFVDALISARKEGKRPVAASSAGSPSGGSAPPPPPPPKAAPVETRAQKIASKKEELNGLRVKELKSMCDDAGVSVFGLFGAFKHTYTFFHRCGGRSRQVLAFNVLSRMHC